MRSYRWCNFFFRASRGGIWLHKACCMKWVIMNITIWLLKMACFLLHTSHTLSIIYNSANFPDQSKHLQTTGKTTSAHFWTCNAGGGERKMAMDNHPNRCRHLPKTHMPVHLTVYINLAYFGGNINSAYCVTWMEEVYCGTMAQMKDKSKRTNLHASPHGSTGCRHRVYYHLLRRQVWAQKHVKPSP